jgi:hypothetical protein
MAGHGYAYDDAFDRAWGVETCGTVAVEEIDAPAALKGAACRYEPTDPDCFGALLASAGVHYPASWRFVDVGSGKGRVLLLAALAGFRRIDGVELGRDLHAAACSNIARFAPHAGEAVIRSHNLDAATFRFPPEPTVCFLNNPFEAPVLERVLGSAEDALTQRPQPFLLIYYHSNHAALIDARLVWERVARGYWRDPSHHYAVYRWAGEATAAYQETGVALELAE